MNMKRIAATIAGFAIFALNLVLETIAGTQIQQKPTNNTVIAQENKVERKIIKINETKENQWTTAQEKRLNELKKLRKKRFLRSSERREYRMLRRQKASL